MMKKTARDIVRRMRCGEYGPDAILADGTQLSKSPAAGLFAECAAHFRRQERRMRGMTFWLVLWLVVATAGGSSLLVFESGSGWYFAGMAGGVAGVLGLSGWIAQFMVRVWSLMPVSTFRVRPGWRVLLWFIPFWTFYWSFRVFPPLHDFPEEPDSSPNARRWTLKMLYYLACLPVIQLFGSVSEELWFTALLMLANTVVLVIFYRVFRRKVLRRLQALAEAYEAAAAVVPAAAPEWRRAWRDVLRGPWRLALGVTAVLAGMWGCDLVLLQTELPGRDFEADVIAEMEKGVSAAAQQKEFRELADRLAEIPYEDGEITDATRQAVRGNAAAAAAFGDFLDRHPDFRLTHNWQEGDRMNAASINALRNYGDHVYAEGIAALKKPDYPQLAKGIRRLTLGAELLCREGTFNGVLASRRLLNDRALLLESMERHPVAWQAWRDTDLSQWIVREEAREAAWRAADRSVLDSEALWAQQLCRARDVAEWNRIGSWLDVKSEILFYYSKSWLGVWEWRRYFNAAKHFRALLDGDAAPLEKWRKKYRNKNDLFAGELLQILDDYRALRQEAIGELRRVRLAIAREMYRRDHRGINPVHDRDLVPRYLKSLPLDPETGKPFDESVPPAEE